MRSRIWRVIILAVICLDSIFMMTRHARADLLVAKWGSTGSGDGQFGRPYGVAVNADGYVYVVDYDNSRVQVFTSAGQFVTKWDSKGSGVGQFQGPCTIAVNATGHVYVGDDINSRVQVYTSTGQYVTEWAASNPNGMAVNGTGYVYVSQYGANRINVFTSTGQIVNWWSGLDGPNGVAVNNATGHVYVTERFKNRVSEFTSTGQLVRYWGSGGIFDGQFNYPYGIAINQSGYIFTTELGNPRVQVFTSTGEFVGKWGSSGTGDGQFHETTGIGVDAIGHVYVTDNFLNRVQVFNPELVQDSWWVLWTVLGTIAAALGAAFVIVRKREWIGAWLSKQKGQVSVSYGKTTGQESSVNIPLTGQSQEQIDARQKLESDTLPAPPPIPPFQDTQKEPEAAKVMNESDKDQKIKELEVKLEKSEENAKDLKIKELEAKLDLEKEAREKQEKVQSKTNASIAIVIFCIMMIILLAQLRF